MTAFAPIYTAFVQALEAMPGGSISPGDLQRLKEKRGLIEETVRKARLCTGVMKRIRIAVDELKKQFKPEDLDKSGITYQGKLSFRWTEDKSAPQGKIIIPYLSPDGSQVLYLRAHKMGPSDVPIQIYGQQVLHKRPEKLVICEGEYKALAYIQCGVPAIAVPGISSFAGNYFQKLVDLLQRFGVLHVVILFDNEIKNDPALPSYKPDPLKRWDTDYYACRMATELYKADFKKSLVARLPDDWRINGKIDPDSALAAGKTAEELIQVLRDATIANNYLDRIPKEGRIIVSYKLARDRLRFAWLKELKGAYWWEKPSDGGPSKKRLSNFILEPTRQVRRADGELERYYKAINSQGEEAEVSLTPTDLSQIAAFRKAFLSHGNFRWNSSGDQLDALLERLFTLASPRVAQEAEFFGRQDDGRWIFGDGIVQGDSGYPLGEDGVIWGNSLEGILPLEDPRCPVPRLATVIGAPPRLEDVYDALAKNLGSKAIGLGLGWVLACVFSDDIFAELGFFPLLGIFGQKGSGKTVLGRWLTSAWGLPAHAQNPIKLEGSTYKGLERTLAKFASLPVWADEYRNDLHQKIVNGLRSVYDRSAGVIAQYSGDLRTRGADIRGCLILSGEEYPTDPALLSRLVILKLSESGRDVESYKAAKDMVEKLPYLVADTIKRRDELLQDVLACIHASYARLRKLHIGDERMLWLYAVPIGAFTALLCDDPDPHGQTQSGRILMELLSWTGEELQRLELLRQEDDDHLARFWTALLILTRTYGSGGQSYINRNHIGLSKDGKYLYVWFPGSYGEIAKYEKQVTGKLPFAKSTIRSYLSECPFIESGKPRRLGGRGSPPVKCLSVLLTHEQAPGVLNSLHDLLLDPDWDRQTFEDDDLEEKEDVAESAQRQMAV